MRSPCKRERSAQVTREAPIFAGVAQLAAHSLGKREVVRAGLTIGSILCSGRLSPRSSPFKRSNVGSQSRPLHQLLGSRPTVGHPALTRRMWVRFLPPQPSLCACRQAAKPLGSQPRDRRFESCQAYQSLLSYPLWLLTTRKGNGNMSVQIAPRAPAMATNAK